MSTWQGNIALVFASIALGLSIYSQTKSTPTDKPFLIQPAKSNLKELAIPEQDRENLIALHGYILDLETRIHELEHQTPTIAPELLASLVKQAIEQQESERRAEIEKRNPALGWLSNLPDDYRERIKADPQYADSSINEALATLLNLSKSENERLAAYGQLKMTLSMLRRDLDESQANAVIDAMISISEYTNDAKIRVSALESLSRQTNVSPKLAEHFQKLLQTDDNNYVRNISATALIGQFFRAMRDGNNSFATDLAERITTLENSSNAKVAEIMAENLKSPRLREELDKALGK
ncbi:hypothetical protein [Pseudoalteromonas sp. SCSIO 43101]|uniref:hypothetical protein n=1 Tax=Pseudoalteromonas sp. SCSIO 43101 TaxID=2822847 RepID=UPI00202B8EF4|nr:hypothetical protein [Pseudoalteromonas sp. SCSIO 43101]URQ90245.1 hypothetical protein J8Z25_16075 [Pseudoalteromonas sp. SCSIO 43101]